MGLEVVCPSYPSCASCCYRVGSEVCREGVLVEGVVGVGWKEVCCDAAENM